MALASKLTLLTALALATSAPALAQRGEHGGGGEHGARPEAHGEPHPGPRGYDRVAEPHGWNNRPHEVDHKGYEHNYQAARVYHIGVYHRPRGWEAHRWGYGDILPRFYWAAPYILADYWLFGLEVPPVGFEWVRDDTDAILVDINTGRILQVEYGVFG